MGVYVSANMITSEQFDIGQLKIYNIVYEYILLKIDVMMD